jgi:hypothetical protein
MTTTPPIPAAVSARLEFQQNAQAFVAALPPDAQDAFYKAMQYLLDGERELIPVSAMPDPADFVPRDHVLVHSTAPASVEMRDRAAYLAVTFFDTTEGFPNAEQVDRLKGMDELFAGMTLDEVKEFVTAAESNAEDIEAMRSVLVRLREESGDLLGINTPPVAPPTTAAPGMPVAPPTPSAPVTSTPSASVAPAITAGPRRSGAPTTVKLSPPASASGTPAGSTP